MTRDSRLPLFVAAILLLLPLYVGSYFALLKPSPDISTPFNELLARRWSNYRVGGRFVELVFWPLEQIDRKVRPGAWGIGPEQRKHKSNVNQSLRTSGGYRVVVAT